MAYGADVATAATAIEWTEATWNPVTGCSKVSPGCAHCYAETLSRWFRWTAEPWTQPTLRSDVPAQSPQPAVRAAGLGIYVLPALYEAGWTDDQIREQVSFTPGRIIVSGGTVRRGKRKRVDYLLSYLRDRPIAVVEAKAEYRLPSGGLQQAKEYAETLDLKFAYSTNGPRIVEHDYTTAAIPSSAVTQLRTS